MGCGVLLKGVHITWSCRTHNMHTVMIPQSGAVAGDVVTAAGEETCSLRKPQRLYSQCGGDPAGTRPEFATLDQL